MKSSIFCSMDVCCCIPFWLSPFVSRLYYRNKLKKPITIMTNAAQHISRNDMGYSCRYDSADEMGQLCRCLDDMRLKIISYQENLWKQAEDQRTLNAAFAHDLRTPLTVMQGYVDLLLRFYPDGRLPKEKVIEILKTMQEQLGRLKNFGGTMKEIHSMEERAPQLKRYRFPYFTTRPVRRQLRLKRPAVWRLR